MACALTDYLNLLSSSQWLAVDVEEDVAEEEDEDVEEAGRGDESFKSPSFFQCVQDLFSHLEILIHFSFVH